MLLNALVEGALLFYMGPSLLGFAPGWRKTLWGGIVVGVAGFLIRSLTDLHYIPMGAHTVIGALVLILVLRFSLPVPWGIASAAALLSFTLLLLTGTASVFGAVFLLGWDFKEVLENPVLRFLFGLLEDLPLGILALLCRFYKFQLFRFETGDPGAMGRL